MTLSSKGWMTQVSEVRRKLEKNDFTAMFDRENIPEQIKPYSNFLNLFLPVSVNNRAFESCGITISRQSFHMSGVKEGTPDHPNIENCQVSILLIRTDFEEVEFTDVFTKNIIKVDVVEKPIGCGLVLLKNATILLRLLQSQ